MDWDDTFGCLDSLRESSTLKRIKEFEDLTDTLTKAEVEETPVKEKTLGGSVPPAPRRNPMERFYE